MGGINPMAFAAMAAAQDPTKWGPLLDAMQVPLPGTPEFMQLTGNPGPGGMPQQDMGAMLLGGPQAGAQPPTGPGAVPGMVDPMNPGGEANLAPAPAPTATPLGPELVAPPPGQAPPSMTPTAPPAQRSPVGPQVKAPDASAARPIMSGGVAGAQKAPDFGGKATLQTPAQMMMAALLQRGAPAATVPTLGSLLRGGKY